MNCSLIQTIQHYIKKRRAQHKVAVALYDMIPSWALVRYYYIVENKPDLRYHYISRTIRYILEAKKVLDDFDVADKEYIIKNAIDYLRLYKSDYVIALFDLEFTKLRLSKSHNTRIAHRFIDYLYLLKNELKFGSTITMRRYVEVTATDETHLT